MRASRRLNSSCESWRANCVESTRSVGSWKVPTLSARAVPQRDARGARRERLVHVDDVQRQRRRAPPRSCGRRRPAAMPPAAAWRERQHLADPSTSGPSSARASSASGSAAQRAPALRTSSAERDGAITSTRCPRRCSSSREPRDVIAHLGSRLPGERTHLRDREALFRHVARVYARRDAAQRSVNVPTACCARCLPAGAKRA